MSTPLPGDTDTSIPPDPEPTPADDGSSPGYGVAPEVAPLAPLPRRAVVTASASSASAGRLGHSIEASIVFAITFAFLALLAPRITTYLSPLTGDEPFYLMTAKSIWEDHDINECNNYRRREEATFYPASVVTSRTLPRGWLGWPSAPYPLPPHPAKIVPASRRCLGSDIKPNYYLPDTSWPLPANGTESELYSKHGLGLAALVMLPYELDGRLLVVLFLNLLGALVAANIYLLARQATGSAFVGVLTWLALAFTVPILPYSYLIFPELPAALMVIYAFRRLWLGHNNALQLFGIGLCLAFLPWLHYRFAPVSLGLGLFYVVPLLRERGTALRARLLGAAPLFLPVVVSAIGLMLYFYFLYKEPFPNGSDHAGISDFAGTVRGMAGSFIDQQWGLLIASPVYILGLVGLALMLFARTLRRELLWIAIIALPYFILISNYAQWWGEWCPPARYLTAILPLLALPFARSLAAMTGIRGVLYGLIYAALTSISFLSTWAFYYQPQWMYNQPNGKSQVLLNALPTLVSTLPKALRPHLSLTDDLPTFVVPYFAYSLQGQESGDSWAAYAWEKSAFPFTVFGILVGFCLALALWQWLATRRRGDDFLGGPQREVLYAPTVREDSDPLVLTAPFRTWFASHELAFAGSVSFPLRRYSAAGFSPLASLVSSALVGRRPRVPSGTGQSPALGDADLGSPAQAPAPLEFSTNAPASVGPALWVRCSRIGSALVAVALGLYGQKLATSNEVVHSLRWYALAIVVLLIGWLGSYRNRSELFVPAVVSSNPYEVAEQPRTSPRLWLSRNWLLMSRYGIALLAVALNLLAVSRLRADHYDSLVGGLGWLASVLLLVAAFVGQRLDAGTSLDAPEPIEAGTWRISRKAEYALIAGLFLFALAVRLYRLDDWIMGMHGDEGEAGMDALGILNGTFAPPFGTGWFQQPNFYYWGIAIGMKVFGIGLFGLRAFSSIVGAAVVLPLYGLGRQWFGIRAAAIAAFLFAISEVGIHFSRQEFSNITTPFFTCSALYFMFLGLRTRKPLFFILSAYAGVLTTYFYLGGRLTPFLLLMVLVYLFGLGVLVRLPGSYRRLRGAMPGASGGRRFLRAVLEQLAAVRGYAGALALFCVAGYVIGAPFLYYYLDNRVLLDARTQEKLILNNPASMAQQYNLTYGPLYVGLRVPRPDDVLPFSPIVFEQTPLSVKISDDGFWPRAFWGQLTRTLSIITYHYDASGVYSFTGNPVAKPLEAVLVILGIAWATLRWRDTRMAALLIWFWATIIIGGALTIDAPYAARLVGMFPALALFAAIIFDKFASEATGLAMSLKGQLRPVRRVAYGLSFASVLLPLAFLSWQNLYDYYRPYTVGYPFAASVGYAVFVRDMNAKAASQGHPVPRYFNMGAPEVIWDYGVNRFLNNGTPGEDLVNPANLLPVIDTENRDLVFMVWPSYAPYVAILQQYYPDAEVAPYSYSPVPGTLPLFSYVKVTKEQLAARHQVIATYKPVAGRDVTRQERAFGTQNQPPPNMQYPIAVEWRGGLLAPAFAHYRFQLASPAAARLEIDGLAVITATGSVLPAQGDVILARGPHDVRLTTTVSRALDRVSLTWLSGSSMFAAISPRYIWDGPGRSLAAEVRPFSNDPFGTPPEDVPGGGPLPVTQRRIDGFLGFREASAVLSPGGAFSTNWTATLEAPVSGNYMFNLVSNGGSYLLIDGVPVVDNRQPAPDGTASGAIDLTAGPHTFTLRYNWINGTGKLEVFWTPPGGSPAMLGPDVLHADGGAWLPGTVSDPPGYILPSENGAATPGANLGEYKIKSVIGSAGDLLTPHGLALDSNENVYVGDQGHHRVVVYAPGGKMLRSWGAAPAEGKEPVGGEFREISDVAVVPDGSVIVLDSKSPLLQVFGPDGTFRKAYDIRKAGLYNPTGLYAAPDGTIYVADTGEGRVVQLGASEDGQSVTEFKLETGNVAGIAKFNQPLDVVLGAKDASGGAPLYVVDAANRVVALDAAGAAAREWPLELGTGDGGSRLAIDAAGQLYITDPDHGRVAILNPGRGSVNYVGTRGSSQDQFGVPSGIAVGSSGSIYVLNSDKAYAQVLGISK